MRAGLVAGLLPAAAAWPRSTATAAACPRRSRPVERANERRSFQGGNQRATAFAAAWPGAEARPKRAFGIYIDRPRQDFPWGSCTDNLLPRSRPGEGLSCEAPLALKPDHCALGMMFSDWNRSGTPALRITDDREYYKGGQEHQRPRRLGADATAFRPPAAAVPGRHPAVHGLAGTLSAARAAGL